MSKKLDRGDNLDDDHDNSDNEDQITPKLQANARPTFKDDYVNHGLDTAHLSLPRNTGPITISKGKLALDNVSLLLDDSIDTFTKSGKSLINKLSTKKNMYQKNLSLISWLNPKKEISKAYGEITN